MTDPLIELTEALILAWLVMHIFSLRRRVRELIDENNRESAER